MPKILTAGMTNWMTGTPVVEKGNREEFWVEFKNYNGDIRYTVLEYQNAYVMGLSEHQLEAPKNAVPVEGGEDEYEWTGWSAPYCEQCECNWQFEYEVIGWIRLPKNFEAAKEAK